MSDTPRTDARLGYGNEHHGANMLCRELERELNAAIKELDDARRAFDDIDMCKLGQALCAWAMQLIEERDALKTDRDAFKREFLKAVEACSFVTAYGSSNVTAYGSSKVTAYGSSKVTKLHSGPCVKVEGGICIDYTTTPPSIYGDYQDGK